MTLNLRDIQFLEKMKEILLSGTIRLFYNSHSQKRLRYSIEKVLLLQLDRKPSKDLFKL